MAASFLHPIANGRDMIREHDDVVDRFLIMPAVGTIANGSCNRFLKAGSNVGIATFNRAGDPAKIDLW